MTDAELEVGQDDAEYRELRRAALRFLGFAFEQLARWHILPAPMARRFLRVGRDYEGADVMPSSQFTAFEVSLRSAFPKRFPQAPGRATELPSGWIFGLLEASIAECVAMEEDFHPGLSFISDLLDELISSLEADTEELVHCRVVTHLTTPSLDPVSVAGVTVFPIANGTFTPEIARAVRERIPMAAQAFGGLPPTVFESPVSLVVAQSATSDNVFDELERLSLRVDRFLLLARLITGSTARSSWAIGGSVRRIAAVLNRPDFRSVLLVRMEHDEQDLFAGDA